MKFCQNSISSSFRSTSKFRNEILKILLKMQPKHSTERTQRQLLTRTHRTTEPATKPGVLLRQTVRYAVYLVLFRKILRGYLNAGNVRHIRVH